MFVRDWMTPDPVTVDDAAAIGKCRELLQIHRIRRLPVLRDGRVAGIVTDRDLRAAETSSVDVEATEGVRRTGHERLDLCFDGHVGVLEDGLMAALRRELRDFFDGALFVKSIYPKRRVGCDMRRLRV